VGLGFKSPAVDERNFFRTEYSHLLLPGFVQTLESPEIKMLRFPGLESPGKGHRSWNSKVVVLKILLPGSSIAP